MVWAVYFVDPYPGNISLSGMGTDVSVPACTSSKPWTVVIELQ
jgi:hypothetical protein